MACIDYLVLQMNSDNTARENNHLLFLNELEAQLETLHIEVHFPFLVFLL